jgi:hypothetical protein
MVAQLDMMSYNNAHSSRTVSANEYQDWRQHFTWHALLGKRIGQSFCEHFDITDYRIYYDSDVDRCLNLIERDYVPSSHNHIGHG